MNQNLLVYKGFYGVVHYSPEDECLYGTIVGITDSISYHSPTARGIRKAFKEAVDDYISTCKSIGKSPLKSYTGNINVRLKPETHLKAAIKAKTSGKSINSLINEAVEKEVKSVSLP
ncbi:MAG: type II toxin-antitoxin system HicB family antitoxin [Fidelibacterota bacterium]